MSEYIHKTQIAALNLSNSELLNEIEDLKAKLQELNEEPERAELENPVEIEHFKKKVAELEQRETEFKARISALTKEAQNYKKPGPQKVIIAFLLGIFASLAAWSVTQYLENDKFYSLLIKRLTEAVKNVI
jgi:regulator of replication initiation timing